jgi:protein-L-isoaspartate(D-aspartate) O-methyltransferase
VIEDRLAAARMIDEQLVRRGIQDAGVLAAMSQVPRHLFVSSDLQTAAYEDRPLPIGHGQTISQPFMVARVTEWASPRSTDRALEVGAGCGYQAAVLSRVCAQVYAVEIVPSLADRARQTLTALGFGNVTIGCFDGGAGWPQEAPFDVIVVSAAAPRVPAMLLDQLADGGRLVVPVGDTALQVLTRVTRDGDHYEIEEDTRCRYVDLVGRYGVGTEIPQA